MSNSNLELHIGFPSEESYNNVLNLFHIFTLIAKDSNIVGDSLQKVHEVLTHRIIQKNGIVYAVFYPNEVYFIFDAILDVMSLVLLHTKDQAQAQKNKPAPQKNIAAKDACWCPTDIFPFLK